MPDNTMLEHALGLANCGFAVYPLHTVADGECSCRHGRTCESTGKHPRTRGGFSEATCDLVKIRDWWTKWPNAGIGINPGHSQLLVLDIDPRHGGVTNLQLLEDELGRLPHTLRVETGGGGWHLYFREIKGRAGSSLRPGVEVKAGNAGVVAPPTVHATGKAYGWTDGDPTDPKQPVEIAELPLAWLEAVRVPNSQRPSQKSAPRQGGGGDSWDSGTLGVCDSVCKSGEMLTPEVLDAISRTLPSEPGDRNRALGQLIGILKCEMKLTLTPEGLYMISNEWHRLVHDTVGTETSRSANYLEARTWWRYRKRGASVPAEAFAQAKAAAPWPEWWRIWPNETMHLLAAACLEMAPIGEVFYLGGRDAGAGLGVSHRTASNCLIELCEDGMLQRVRPGTRRDSAEYRVIVHPDDLPDLARRPITQLAAF